MTDLDFREQRWLGVDVGTRRELGERAAVYMRLGKTRSW